MLVFIMAEMEATSSFSFLQLDSWLIKQCRELGIRKPTEIQMKCIPKILEGYDCIGCAKTGSGKTAAFALPIIQKLSEDPYGIYALVLTPTRELAFQIADQFRALGKSIGIKDVVVVGGMDTIQQSIALSKKPHVVIATPGRLADLLKTCNTFSLSRIQFLVLDEADRLLEPSFSDDLSTIFDNIPKKRQTLLFSATLTDTIEELKGLSGKEPFCYEVKTNVATVEELDQRYILVPDMVKDCYLIHLLKEKKKESSVIVFTSTRKNCQILSMLCRDSDLPCSALHSTMLQKDRLASVAKFKTGTVKILVATDVASRGLDIPTVELVINSNVPANPKDYIHRVGRTARAGRGGMALTLITQYDIERVQAIEKKIKTKLTEYTVNENDALKILKAVSIARREIELRVKDDGFDEKRENNKRKKLILDGKNPEETDNRRKRKRRKKKEAQKEGNDTQCT